MNVSWFEEPVSSADLDGLRLVREHGPAGLEIAAGEYAYVPADFRNLIGCVDCLQADVTRCGGITGLLSASGLANAYGIDLSAHCAPAASTHAFCGSSGDATSSTSTITCASSRCSSTASRCPTAGRSDPTARGWATVSS